MSAVSFVVLALIASRQYVASLDYTVQAWVQGGRHPALETPVRALTWLGSGWMLAPLSAVGYVWLRHARHPLARYLPATVVGAFLLDGLSKWLVSRPRPRGTAYGFPSGHTLGATIFFGGVLYVLWTSPVPRAWRWVGTALSVLIILGVAYSRLYLNAHWASDVAGGVVGGAAYVLFVLAGIDRGVRAAASDTRRDTA
jgi:membrane-associated phospholipid phosphatase